jgi:hypothetical protein
VAERRRAGLRKRRFGAVLAGLYVLFWATYMPINAFSVGRAAHTLFLPGEERLPFLTNRSCPRRVCEDRARG